MGAALIQGALSRCRKASLATSFSSDDTGEFEKGILALHLLNGHLGKGQRFDRVVVLGLED
jgi:hypothetical protein